MTVAVRPFTEADLPWAEGLVGSELAGRLQARRGELIDALAQDGLVAEDDGRQVGLLTYRLDGDECELVLLAAADEGAGIGTTLVEALRATVGPDRRIWVVTTNDNVDALAFYQRRGFRLRELRAGAVDESRRTLKPQIGTVGRHGIPRRDELELEQPPG